MARTRERAEASYRDKRPIEALSLLADLAKLELEYGVRLNDPAAFSLLHAERSFEEAVTIAKRLDKGHKDAVKASGLLHAETPLDALIDRLEVSGQPLAAEALRLSNHVAAVRILLDALLAADGKTDPAPPE
jgi:hypothetical protein